MAWGLEARVPFLDKAFLEVAMNIDPKDKMFSKGSEQEVDADGCPKMEKVCVHATCLRPVTDPVSADSTSSGKRSIARRTARYVGLRPLPYASAI